MWAAAALLIGLAPVAPSRWLAADTLTACDGRRVTAVDIVRSDRVTLDRTRTPAVVRALLKPLLFGAPSRAAAIEPWLQLHVGGSCSELRRAESERLLRLLPYIADAEVLLLDDGAAGVRVQVTTVDDIRPIVGVGLSGSSLTNLELGSTSIDGSGHLAAVRWQRGGAFRDYVGARYTDFHFLGGPNLASVAIAQTPLGSFGQATIGRPFLTDLQHVAAFGGVLRDEGYLDYLRTGGDPLSLAITRTRTDAGMAFRLRTPGQGSWLLGALAMQERREAGQGAVRITDQIVDTVARELQNRFGTATTTRVGLVAGVRALSFVKATAFDGLESVQDVGRGIQLSAVVGQAITGDRGPFAATDLYTGVGTARSFVGLRVQGEARATNGKWGDAVLSGRLAFYARPSARQTRMLSVEYAGATVDSVPYQLLLADGATGMRGYSGSQLGGAQRLIVRAERRWMFKGLGQAFGWGGALFADAGKLWAGRVPFGQNAFRNSAGVGLLAAVPRASRSLGRIEIAYPVVADAHAKGIDVRVSYRIAARAFWREPFALTRARVMNPTTDIFGWP
jgi:hypothetical protein